MALRVITMMLFLPLAPTLLYVSEVEEDTSLQLLCDIEELKKKVLRHDYDG
ncbi:hypothetical protein O9992_12260 [Vibrio lentus]|nr:hypothetical protein [Vibrio lentus]